MNLLCSSAPLFDAKGGENHRTREREREREDSFGCRKSQRFIQNLHMKKKKKKKKALVVGETEGVCHLFVFHYSGLKGVARLCATTTTYGGHGVAYLLNIGYE